MTNFLKLPWGQKDPLSSKSSSIIGDLHMSAKPTTVTIYYRDGKKDTMECVYAKPGNGALIVATKLSNSERWQFKYIPFSNPDIDNIVVESEAKEEGSGRSSHSSHDR
jgi:hypothetical protein